MDGAGQNYSSSVKDPTLRTGLLYGGATLLFVLAAFFLLNYFNILSLSEVFPTTFSWLPHRPFTTQNRKVPSPGALTPTNNDNLETCSVQKEGNPLVDDVRTIQTKPGEQTIVGTFRGNINNITYDHTKLVAVIELISPKGDQNHNFTLTEQKGLVYDAVALRDLALADLAKGQTVVMSFNCFSNKSKDKQFKITRVAITAKL